MSKYKSTPFMVAKPSAEISEKFADLSQLQSVLDQMPEDQRSQIGEVTFSRDSVEIDTAQVGKVRFQVVERTPDLVKFTAAGAPMPINLDVNLKPKSEDSTEVSVAFDVEVPMMLRPFIAPHMQKAVDMLGSLIANVAAR